MAALCTDVAMLAQRVTANTADYALHTSGTARCARFVAWDGQKFSLQVAAQTNSTSRTASRNFGLWAGIRIAASTPRRRGDRAGRCTSGQAFRRLQRRMQMRDMTAVRRLMGRAGLLRCVRRALAGRAIADRTALGQRREPILTSWNCRTAWLAHPATRRRRRRQCWRRRGRGNWKRRRTSDSINLSTGRAIRRTGSRKD